MELQPVEPSLLLMVPQGRSFDFPITGDIVNSRGSLERSGSVSLVHVLVGGPNGTGVVRGRGVGVGVGVGVANRRAGSHGRDVGTGRDLVGVGLADIGVGVVVVGRVGIRVVDVGNGLGDSGSGQGESIRVSSGSSGPHASDLGSVSRLVLSGGDDKTLVVFYLLERVHRVKRVKTR